VAAELIKPQLQTIIEPPIQKRSGVIAQNSLSDNPCLVYSNIGVQLFYKNITIFKIQYFSLLFCILFQSNLKLEVICINKH